MYLHRRGLRRDRGNKKLILHRHSADCHVITKGDSGGLIKCSLCATQLSHPTPVLLKRPEPKDKKQNRQEHDSDWKITRKGLKKNKLLHQYEINEDHNKLLWDQLIIACCKSKAFPSLSSIFVYLIQSFLVILNSISASCVFLVTIDTQLQRNQSLLLRHWR